MRDVPDALVGDELLKDAIALATLRDRPNRCRSWRQFQSSARPWRAAPRCALTAGHEGMHVFVILSADLDDD